MDEPFSHQALEVGLPDNHGFHSQPNTFASADTDSGVGVDGCDKWFSGCQEVTFAASQTKRQSFIPNHYCHARTEYSTAYGWQQRPRRCDLRRGCKRDGQRQSGANSCCKYQQVSVVVAEDSQSVSCQATGQCFVRLHLCRGSITTSKPTPLGT